MILVPDSVNNILPRFQEILKFSFFVFMYKTVALYLDSGCSLDILSFDRNDVLADSLKWLDTVATIDLAIPRIAA